MQISAKNTNKNLTETGLPCQGMESIDEEININSNLKTIQKRTDKNSTIFTNYTNARTLPRPPGPSSRWC